MAFSGFDCVKKHENEKLNEEEDESEYEDSLRSLQLTIKKELKLIAIRKGRKKEKEGGGGNGRGRPISTEDIAVSNEERPASTEARSLSLPVKRVAISLSGTRMLLRNEKVTVRTRFLFRHVGLIDTLSGKFYGDIFIQSKWLEPLLDGHKEKLTGSSIEESEIEWKPNLTVQNASRETQQQVWYSVAFGNEDTGFLATVCETRQITGQFWISTDLHRFPLDTQILTVVLSSERDEAELELMEDPLKTSSVRTGTFVDQSEWELHSSVETWKGTAIGVNSIDRPTSSSSCSKSSSSRRKHPLLTAACRVSRRPSFFAWNIFVLMFFIGGLSFATFSIPETSASTRIQLTLIPVISSFSYKFMITQSLPKVPYLTYLDKYMMGLQMVLLFTAIWHSIFSYLRDDVCQTKLSAMDVVAFGVLFSAFVSFNIFVFCFFLIYQKKNKRADQTSLQDTVNEAFDEESMDAMSSQLRRKKQDGGGQEETVQNEVISTLAGFDAVDG